MEGGRGRDVEERTERGEKRGMTEGERGRGGERRGERDVRKR